MYVQFWNIFRSKTFFTRCFVFPLFLRIIILIFFAYSEVHLNDCTNFEFSLLVRCKSEFVFFMVFRLPFMIFCVEFLGFRWFYITLSFPEWWITLSILLVYQCTFYICFKKCKSLKKHLPNRTEQVFNSLFKCYLRFWHLFLMCHGLFFLFIFA